MDRQTDESALPSVRGQLLNGDGAVEVESHHCQVLVIKTIVKVGWGRGRAPDPRVCPVHVDASDRTGRPSGPHGPPVRSRGRGRGGRWPPRALSRGLRRTQHHGAVFWPGA